MVASGRLGGVLSWVLFVMAAGIVLRPVAAIAAPDAKAVRPPATAQLELSVNALAQDQKVLSAGVYELRSQVSELQKTVAELREELRQKQEAAHGVAEQTLTQVKEMREEVRGLYVESSGIKGDVALVAKQVEDLDANLDSFRLSAGIIVAVVIVLQLVLTGLVLRNRG